MSNRLNSPAERQRSLPSEVGDSGWTTLDYMLASGFAWSLMVASPILMAPPLWVSALMSPSD
jgi:hypothetical protein